MNVQLLDRPADLVASQPQMHGPPVSLPENVGEVGMADRRSKRQLGRQRGVRRVVALLDGTEPDHDVRSGALRADERLRLRFALAEFGQYLLGGVPALGGIPLDLPVTADVLGRGAGDGDVEARPSPPGVRWQAG